MALLGLRSSCRADIAHRRDPRIAGISEPASGYGECGSVPKTPHFPTITGGRQDGPLGRGTVKIVVSGALRRINLGARAGRHDRRGVGFRMSTALVLGATPHRPRLRISRLTGSRSSRSPGGMFSPGSPGHPGLKLSGCRGPRMEGSPRSAHLALLASITARAIRLWRERD